jgi:hypothetical protein
MNNEAPKKFATAYVGAILALAAAVSQAGGRADMSIPLHADVAAKPHAPLGIEGNGLLGIEGNGIIQRLDNGNLVVNDSLYVFGPGTVRVIVDGAAAFTSIRPGHVVQVGARADNGGGASVLAQIELEHLLRGPIDSGGIDLNANSIRVLGQDLPLPAFVELGEGADDLKIGDFADGDYVQVSGWLDASGNILAGRVQRTAPVFDTLEISGRVSAVDAVNRILQIGDLVIDYSSAQFVYMSASQLQAGDDLEVVGSVLNGEGQLLATRVRQVPDLLSGYEGQEVEVQGFATQPLLANEFILAGQSIRVSGSTEYVRGTSADVQPGRLLEVEGTIAADGALEASRVEFDEEVVEAEIRIAGVVESVDPQTQQFGLFGLTISATLATRYDDKTGSATPFVDFSDMQPGIFVELRGYDDPDGSNLVTTTRIEREVPGDTTLKARVTGNDGTSISLLGLALLTDSGTVYVDASGQNVTEQQFVYAAQVGVLIRATGAPLPGGIDVTLLEIE